MNRLIKYIAAAIIITAFIFGTIIAWKVLDSIRQDVRQDLQESFEESLKKYGKDRS